MASSPLTPRLLKAGLVRVDGATGALIEVVPLQYNPDTLSRTLQPRGAGDGAPSEEATRLTGPPTETFTVEAELDATDALEAAGPTDDVATVGLWPQLAILERMLYPGVEAMRAANAQAARGSIEVLPAPEPLTVFVWGRSRVMPVRLTDMTITEEAFDTALNPIRAKVKVSMRVLNANDLGFSSWAASLYLAYQTRKEGLAAQFGGRALTDLGLEALQ
ncbi:hypothetical protein SAMN05518801_101341 [Novosphingobium sp. CF614]|uniref:hypothetical protein n=1 Tax=Novosphingobium sp. CF614 TaxID=1884364 RepID=UPI0008E467A5|nr:hypothetical protein [Novosphingobium sp. CF614]SFF76425.1 hypothetical protein SAMN05518801_101341 [Novosphingobium sp. CF614]